MSASNALKVKSLGVYYASLFVLAQKLLEDKLINAAVRKNKIKKNNFIKWHIGPRRQCFWKHCMRLEQTLAQTVQTTKLQLNLANVSHFMEEIAKRMRESASRGTAVRIQQQTLTSEDSRGAIRALADPLQSAHIVSSWPTGVIWREFFSSP